MFENEKKQGRVKFINLQKGFGFIKPDGEEKDIFVHVSQIMGGTIDEGDRVEFEVEKNDRGLQAMNVVASK